MVKRAVVIALLATACLSESDYPQDVFECAVSGRGCECSSATTDGALTYCDAPTNGVCCQLIIGSLQPNTCTCSDASNAPRTLHACANTDNSCVCSRTNLASSVLSDWTLDSCAKPAGGHCCNETFEQCVCSLTACTYADDEVSSCEQSPIPTCAEGESQLPGCTALSVSSANNTPEVRVNCINVGDTCQCEASARFVTNIAFGICSAPTNGTCCADAPYFDDYKSGFCTCSPAATCPSGKTSVVDCY